MAAIPTNSAASGSAQAQPKTTLRLSPIRVNVDRIPSRKVIAASERKGADCSFSAVLFLTNANPNITNAVKLR